MRGRKLTVRTIALMGAGSAAIHQLRYAIGYGEGASSALAAHPHGYMEAALPGIATALLITLASLLMRLAGADPRLGADARAVRGRVRTPFARLWLGCTLTLAFIYAAQETLEGSGAIAHGGWIGIALAIPAGLLVALAIRGAAAAESARALVTLVAVRLQVLRFATRSVEWIAAVTVDGSGARAPPLAPVV